MRLPIILLFALPVICSGQSPGHDVLAVQGNFSTGKSMSLSWTIGEPFITTAPGTDGYITEGFQQPEIIIRKTAPNGSLEATVYPNPAKSSVTIELTAEEICRLQLVDVAGQILYDRKMPMKTQHIDVSGYPAGTYFVILNGLESSRQAHFSIIKY